jgi:hypothetical protein
MAKWDNKPYSNFKSSGTSFDFLRFAEITRVDYFKHTVDIKYLDGENYATDVMVANPFISPNSFMGGMPDIGSIVVCYYFRLANNQGYPCILGFIPRNIFFSYDFEPVYLRSNIENSSDQIALTQRFKNWKLYPGDFWVSSKAGADLRLDEGVFLQNSAMNEINLDPFSQIASIMSQNQVLNSKAGRINFGFIHRNELIGNKDFGTQFLDASQYLTDGRLFYRVTDAPKTAQNPYGTLSIDNNGINGYTEFRLDLKEYSDLSLDLPEESSGGANLSPLYKANNSQESGKVTKPLVSLVVGTLVGNDAISSEGRKNYGKILMPVTFADNKTRTPDNIIATEQQVVNENGINGEKTQAGAFQVKIPNTLTSFNFTKEGVLEFSLDKSSSIHPLGAGRSANIGMTGSLKMMIGKEASDGKSLILDLLGGAQVFIGGESTNNRSLDVLMTNGLNFEIIGSDAGKNSIRGRIKNNVDLVIDGNRFTEVKGDDIYLIHGKLEHRVLGKKVDNFINDKSNNYGGGLKENVTADYQSNIGAGRKVVIAAPNLASGSLIADKERILLGNKELEMLLGNYTQKLIAGTYKEDILIGGKTTDIGIGNFKVSVGLGNINIETILGNVSIGTKVGQMSLEALTITMKALQITAKAPIVRIGSLTQGGVVNSGPAGHKDYLTGLPLLGSVTVTCNTI